MEILAAFFLKFLLVLLIFSPVAFYFIAKPSDYNKTVLLDRPEIGNIRILRDEFAVPHLISEKLIDIYYGIGFVQAQDRLWEMNFKKLIFSGRLSEYFGRKTLEIDQLMRNFGFYRASTINYENMHQEERQYLQAFADGVNDYVNILSVLPMQFLITGVKIEEWTPVDSIMIIKFMEFSLTLKWAQQLLNYHLQDIYDREFIKEITGSGEEYQFDKTMILNDEELIQSQIFDNSQINKATKTVKTFIESPEEKNLENSATSEEYLSNELKDMIESIYQAGKGSNSWVIHGNHTKSGKPIVANDPHLDNSMPSVWYPIYITYGSGENFKVFGFTNAGSPFIVIGETPKVSWGITAFLGDDSDLYRERLNEERTHYEIDGKFYPLKILKEEIKIKGEKSLIEIVKSTKHGVLLNRNYDLSANGNVYKHRKIENFAFGWTGYLSENSLVKLFLEIHNASNVYDLRKAASICESVYVNLVFADVEGNIGYFGTGLHKIKKRNDNEFFPLDGSNSENDWIGFVPKNESIFVINPKKGYIVTANNKPSSNNIKYDYVRSGKPTGRAKRINNLIKSFIDNNKKIGVDDVKKMQLDTIDEYAKIICPLLLKILNNYLNIFQEESQKIIIKHMVFLLEKWDFDMSADSKQALIYNVWYYTLAENFFNKEVNSEIFKKIIVTRYGYEQFLMRKLIKWTEGLNLDSKFCQNNENRKKSNISCIMNVVNSLLEAKSYIENNLGEESQSWKWKNLHFAEYSYHPFSKTPLKFIFHRTVGRSGNMNTINVALPKNQEGKGFSSFHSANLRFISNLDKIEKSYFVIDTGVSESPLSHHFTDQMKLHFKGEYLEIKQDWSDSFYEMELLKKNNENKKKKIGF